MLETTIGCVPPTPRLLAGLLRRNGILPERHFLVGVDRISGGINDGWRDKDQQVLADFFGHTCPVAPGLVFDLDRTRSQDHGLAIPGNDGQGGRTRTIPKGLWPPAQGCPAFGATLGQLPNRKQPQRGCGLLQRAGSIRNLKFAT